jgi:hypothetical protein
MSQQHDISPSMTGTGATVTILDTGKLHPWLMVVSLFSGIAIAISIMTLIITVQRFDDLATKTALAEREARVLQERVSDMKVELIKNGIAVSDH